MTETAQPSWEGTPDDKLPPSETVENDHEATIKIAKETENNNSTIQNTETNITLIIEQASATTSPTANAKSTFIRSTVTNPQKEQDGSQTAYISFLVTTESNSPTFQSPSFRVRRRFTDFHFLYTALHAEFPACAIPPLGDKSRLEYIKGDRFGSEFTLKRASSLNTFLNRISAHPILRKSTTYLNFLETPDWNSFKKSLSSRNIPAANESSILEGVSDSLLQAFSKTHVPDTELISVKERVGKLEYTLSQVEKVFTKVLRRQGDLSYDLDDFSQQLIKLAGLEKNLEQEIVSFANGTHFLSQATNTLREQVESDYVVSLRNMQHYIVSLKNLIKLREQKQLDYEALVEYFNKATNDKGVIQAGGGSSFLRNKIEDVRGVNHEAARQERLRKLETKIQNLGEEIEKEKKNTAFFQETTTNEVKIFENTKQLEMKSTLSNLADNHINYYQNVINQWSALL